MSRAIFETPTTRPVASRTGDTVSEMSTSVPSLRRRTVSKIDGLAAADAGQDVGLLGPGDRAE